MNKKSARVASMLGLIALSVYFIAQSVNTLALASLPLVSGAQNRVTREAKPEGEREIDRIIHRNLFCSACEETTFDRPREVPVGPLDLPLRLLATLVSEDPTWSLAAIRQIPSKRTGLYGIGARLPGGGRVTGIEALRVEVEANGQTGCLTMEEKERRQGRALHPQKPNHLQRGIRSLGKGRFEIDRRLIEWARQNSPKIARTIRIVPRTGRGGRLNGMQLLRVRPGSLFSLLGLRDGDILRSANGRSITPEAALTLYSQLGRTTHLTISFERGGKALTHDYTIR